MFRLVINEDVKGLESMIRKSKELLHVKHPTVGGRSCVIGVYLIDNYMDGSSMIYLLSIRRTKLSLIMPVAKIQ